MINLTINGTASLELMKEIIEMAEYYQTTDGLNEIEQSDGKVEIHCEGDNGCFDADITEDDFEAMIL